jgi:hypothetical protein
MSRALSLPHEHGGYLTIAGAAAAGVALAHARGPALAVGAITAAAFFAHAPVEQLARGRGARWDGAAVAALAAVVGGGALALDGAWAAVALAIAGAIVAGSALARRARVQRSPWFETFAMAALGACAGLIAVAGGAQARLAVGLAIVIGTHAGVAVPLVRAEVRPRERDRARVAAHVALAAVGVAASLLLLLGVGRLAVALLPRGLHALTRAMVPPQPARPSIVGMGETARLACVVLALVLMA